MSSIMFFVRFSALSTAYSFCIGFMYYPIVGSDTFVMFSFINHVLSILVISKAL